VEHPWVRERKDSFSREEKSGEVIIELGWNTKRKRG